MNNVVKKVFVKERFVLPVAVKDELLSLEPQFGYGQFGEVVFYRTYSRIKADGRMETWNDVVIRCVEGIFSIRKDWYIKNSIAWDEDFWNTYARGFALSMFHMHWLPPGRGLWAMGTDFIYERGSMALNNCGFTVVGEDIGDACHWIMDALMSGVGAGYEPTRNDDFEAHYPIGEYNFTIEDSREGWCDSVKAAIDCYCKSNQRRPVFDYNKIRPAGLSIRGFGGVSSGPEPLVKLHGRIERFFEMYLEEDWYDTILLKADIVNSIGACVIAGNVRRSAEICLGSIHDQVFLDLKNYEKYPYRAEWGWMSNNSAIMDCNEDYARLGEIANRVINNGEPGIFNRQNVKYGRLGKFKDTAKVDKATGQNPCSKASLLLITKSGLRRLGDLGIGDEIWSERGWTKILNKWSNGIKEVYRYHTTVGHIDLTEDHKVVSDGMKFPIGITDTIDRLSGPSFDKMDLCPFDIMDGLVQGDGTKRDKHILLCIGKNDQDYFTSEISHLIGKRVYKDPKSSNEMYHVEHRHSFMVRTYDRTIPERYLCGDPKKVAGFLRGVFSANGSFVGGLRITLKSTSLSVIVSVCKMLSSLGISSYYTTNKETVIEHWNGEYTSRMSHDLNIARKEDVWYFMRIIGFLQEYKNDKVNKMLTSKICNGVNSGRDKQTYKIIEEEYLGEEEVFDITVDNSTNTFWGDGFNISNCGEQPLEDRELCTLVETFPTRCKDTNEWLKACEYATVYASTVTLLPTHRSDTNAVMLRNRRIGVGLVDFSGWKHTLGLNKVIRNLREGYNRVRNVNHWCQSEAGVPDSIRVTTVKPGGSVPKIAGRTAGCGHPNFHNTLRRMRIAMDSPMVPLLIEANVPYEVDVASDRTYVFEFPILQGPAKPASEVSMWEQIANVVTLQREWSDNAVSNTITFIPEWETALIDQPISNIDFKQFEGKQVKLVPKPDQCVDIKVRNEHHEEGDIEHALAAHAFSIKSLSLLPASNRGCYPQMPEEGISPEEYNDRVSKIGKIDWSRLRHSVAEPERYCTGDACELAPK